MKKHYEMPKIVREKNKPFEKLVAKLEHEPDLKFIEKIYARFPDAQIYVVGGTVRDVLMGREDSKDYDLVVRGVPTDKLGAALEELGRVDLVGARFGVFKFVPKDSELKNAIDIALPRREFAFGTGGYRDFETQSDPNLSIEEDLSRRDFTWNAMAYELRSEKLVDPFGGLLDIEEKIIRTVGKPEERFAEDYSRILRAIRFATKFDFQIDAKTWKTIKELSDHINDEREKDGEVERIVPYEVISRELLKALHANPVRAFELYSEAELLYKLIPELEAMEGCPQPPEYHSEGDVWTHAKMALGNLGNEEYKKFFGDEKPDPELVFAVLLHDIGKPATLKTPEKDGTNRIRFDGHDVVGAKMAKEICKRLRVDSAPDLDVSTERVVWLVRYHLFTLNPDLDKVRNTTLEKYFFNPNLPGKKLLRVTFADASAAIPKIGNPDLTNLKKLMARLDALEKLKKEQPELPKPILDGNQIMEILALKPGSRLGKIILELREAQLSRKIETEEEARKFLETMRH